MLIEQALSRARERLVLIQAEALVSEAAQLMAKPHIDLLIVCDGGAMVGVVTKTDVVAQIGGDSSGSGFGAKLDTIMTREVASCAVTDALPDVWQKMQAIGLQRIPVLGADGNPVGVLYARDVLQLLLGEVEFDDEMLRDYITGVGYG